MCPITFPGEGRVAGVVEAHGRSPAASSQAVRRGTADAVDTGRRLRGPRCTPRCTGSCGGPHRGPSAPSMRRSVQRAEELKRSSGRRAPGRRSRQLVAAERLRRLRRDHRRRRFGLGKPWLPSAGMAQLALVESPHAEARSRLEHVIDNQADRLGERMRALLRGRGRPVEGSSRFGRPRPRGRTSPARLDPAPMAVAAGVALEIAVPAELPKARIDPGPASRKRSCVWSGNALDAMAGRRRSEDRGQAGGSGRWDRQPTSSAIQDTGPGIAPGVLVQGVSSRSSRPSVMAPASGLPSPGSSWRRQGPGLVLESEVGRGTRAVLVLPAVDKGM